MVRVVAFLMFGFIGACYAADELPSSPSDVPTATHVYAGVGISDVAPVKEEDGTAPQVAVQKKPSRSLVSINTDSPLDMNWSGAMELSDPALRPSGVVLPFMEDYPIENLEIKFNLLNLRF